MSTCGDLGLDEGFEASMVFVQATLQNINAGYQEPILDIDFIRSRDLATVGAAFTAPCNVLHLMAHSDDEETPTFLSSDGELEVPLNELGAYAAETLHSGISTGPIIADGCGTATGEWRKAVRDCLQGPVTYIGTPRPIGWDDSTVFSSSFYGALTRNRGKGFSPSEQARDAACRAQKAYEVLTGRRCPYKIYELKPSRLARKAFA